MDRRVCHLGDNSCHFGACGRPQPTDLFEIHTLARDLLILRMDFWQSEIRETRMNSEIVGLLVPEGSAGATLLVRRANGQFAFERIDARLGVATRAAALWAAGKGSAVATASSEFSMV